MRRLLAITAALAAAALLLPGAASALTFSPPTFDFSANPGDTLNDAVRLYNEGTEPVTLKAEAVNFTSKEGDETSGTPEFYAADEIRDGHGLAPWIAFVNKDLTLQPGEYGSIFFEIKVPSDAGPGSYFGAVLVTSLSPRPDQGVGVVGNTAVLVLLKVNGDAVEDLKLTAFTASPKFASSLPVRFEARVENAGTVHLRPFGEVVIKDLFGRTVAAVPINRFEYKSVLPGGARRYAAEWLKEKLPEDASAWESQWENFAFGPYTAELSMEYGSQKKILAAGTRFWVIPWMPLAAGLALAAALVIVLMAFLAWYRKRIIAQLESRKPQAASRKDDET